MALLLDHPGVYPLKDHGLRESVVLTEQAPRQDPLRYTIPRLRGKATPRYYKVRLRFRIDLGEPVPRAFGYVTAGSPNNPFASAEFKERGSGSSPVVSWNTVNVDGQRSHRTRSRTIDVAFDNYFTPASSRPGTHRLRFDLERFGGLRVNRVEVSARSALEVTSEPPYTLRLRVSPPRRYAKNTSVDVRLINIGRRPARDVTLESNHESACARVIGASTRTFGTIRGRRVRHATMRYRRLTRGRCPVQLAGSGSTGSATADFYLPGLQRARAQAASPISGVGIATIVLAWSVAVGAWTLTARRRRRRAT